MNPLYITVNTKHNTRGRPQKPRKENLGKSVSRSYSNIITESLMLVHCDNNKSNFFKSVSFNYFIYIKLSLSPHNNPMMSVVLFIPIFQDEETEARGTETTQRRPTQVVGGQAGIEPSSLCPEVHTLICFTMLHALPLNDAGFLRYRSAIKVCNKACPVLPPATYMPVHKLVCCLIASVI